jgi:lysylphosphatidylglycerol synthetase-like protein (DUF2156 family)
VSLAFGQQFFPNSVIAKSALGTQSNRRSVSLGHGLHALGTDHAVLLLFAAALAYLVAAAFGRVQYSVVPATVTVVTTLLHSMFAGYHWFERYQAYLIALGLFFIVGAARRSASLRARPAG